MSTSWDRIIGQPLAVRDLQAAIKAPLHAYLLVGHQGAGTRTAALVFAGELLAASGGDADRHRRLAAAEQHPDVLVVSPEGRSLRRVEAELIITEASRSPIEGRRKVIIVERFHTAEPEAAASLLKTIEEPPATVVFVLLAEHVLPDHVTIASRCVKVAFPPVSTQAIVDYLAESGHNAEQAELIAAAAAGNIDRAALLATDASFAGRVEAWRSIPDMLDGTGSRVSDLVANLRALIDDAQLPLSERHKIEMAEAEEWEEQFGLKGSRRRGLEERQRREARVLREDELRLGFATLAGAYRDRLLITAHPELCYEATKRITAATEALERNPNEMLLLEALLCHLTSR